jgi:hypothetical protein
LHLLLKFKSADVQHFADYDRELWQQAYIIATVPTVRSRAVAAGIYNSHRANSPTGLNVLFSGVVLWCIGPALSPGPWRSQGHATGGTPYLIDSTYAHAWFTFGVFLGAGAFHFHN